MTDYLSSYFEESHCLVFDVLLTETTPIIAEYVVFLLDSSSAVRPDHFKKEKDFIKNLAKSLYVGVVEKTWAAVVNYGSFPFSSISFYDYSTLAEFESALDRITPADGL